MELPVRLDRIEAGSKVNNAMHLVLAALRKINVYKSDNESLLFTTTAGIARRSGRARNCQASAPKVCKPPQSSKSLPDEKSRPLTPAGQQLPFDHSLW